VEAAAAAAAVEVQLFQYPLLARQIRAVVVVEPQAVAEPLVALEL
jgi:hypothetical protein